MNKRIISFLLILCLLALFSLYLPEIKQLISQTGITGNQITNEYYDRESAILLRVIDGDTIEVIFEGEDNKESVRLLGINTPEKKMPMYQEAKDFLKQFENKSIELLRYKEDKDKYNRKLRYVFYNNELLNTKILEKGLANSYILDNLIYEKELIEAENQARTNQVGIWQPSKERCAINNCINLKELNEKSEFFILINICDFQCDLSGWFAKDSGRNTFALKPLNSQQQITYNSKTDSNLKRDVWDNHDNFFIFDSEGKLVFYYEY